MPGTVQREHHLLTRKCKQAGEQMIHKVLPSPTEVIREEGWCASVRTGLSLKKRAALTGKNDL